MAATERGQDGQRDEEDAKAWTAVWRAIVNHRLVTLALWSVSGAWLCRSALMRPVEACALKLRGGPERLDALARSFVGWSGRRQGIGCCARRVGHPVPSLDFWRPRQGVGRCWTARKRRPTQWM